MADDLIVNQGIAAAFSSTARAAAISVAGNFDRNSNNGDEIGLYYSGTWFLDTNHDYILDKVFTGNLVGTPIVGDFDGNGFDDLAVFNNNQFFFDLSFNPLADTTTKTPQLFGAFPACWIVRWRPTWTRTALTTSACGCRESSPIRRGSLPSGTSSCWGR